MTEVEILAVLAALAFPVGLAFGSWYGRRSALHEHRPYIEAGREYQTALDSATAKCMPGQSFSVSLVVEKRAQPAETGKVHLTDVEGAKAE